jgi:hypothetical protein
MTKKTKIIIGVSAFIVIGGVTLLIIANKKKKQKDDCSSQNGIWDDETKTCTDSTTNNVVEVSTSSSSSSSRPSTGFTSKAEGDAFRVWVNTKYPIYATSILLDKSGAFDNSFIRKAYEKYGAEYLAGDSRPAANESVKGRPASTNG